MTSCCAVSFIKVDEKEANDSFVVILSAEPIRKGHFTASNDEYPHGASAFSLTKVSISMSASRFFSLLAHICFAVSIKWISSHFFCDGFKVVIKRIAL